MSPTAANLKWFLTSFEGRATRTDFWKLFLPVLALVYVPTWLLHLVSKDAGDSYQLLALLVALWPSLAVQSRRWHDRNRSAWWIAINLIPYIGTIWALIDNGCIRGTVGPNPYGADPLGESATGT